ncbi:MAG: ATP-grasp domain-containing protein [Sedimentisphaerales bacterium]|nr:ATP-grasp domain-containing protein [Sedimentisphaerales bacterium]
MSRKLNIAAFVDDSTINTDDPEFMNPPEKADTEYHVIEALREFGYNVSVTPVSSELHKSIEILSQLQPDLVFNLTEEYNGDRMNDKNLAALLELLGMPYTGSGPGALMLCRDKRLCKELLSHHKIKVPGFVSIPVGKKVKVPKNISWPLVVKPALEDSSEGISNASVVYDEQSLQERADFIHQKWTQPVIAEEYVEGREFYVAVLGNKRLDVLPIRECKFGNKNDKGPLMATYKVKWDVKFREKWDISFGFAELEDSIFEQIKRVCKKVFHILELRDYGRIDLRLTPDNKIIILEVNPNPDLAYGEEVAEAAEKAGIAYRELIDKLVKSALRRNS